MATPERVTSNDETENIASSIDSKQLFNLCMKGEWEEVVNMYTEDERAHTAIITKSRDTALHVAVTDGKEDVVEKLVKLVVAPEKQSSTSPGVEGINESKEKEKKEALGIQNKRGNIALHFAASMGTLKMIECIASADPSLICVRNGDGETPLFLAALHGRKDAFMTLHSICHKDQTDINYKNCRRNDGDTILHSAINGDYFDLTFQIIHLYEKLVNWVNENGDSPLHLLASKPSAFRSGSRLGRVEIIIYYGIYVKELKPETNFQQYLCKMKVDKNNSYPENYKTCMDLLNVAKHAAIVVTNKFPITRYLIKKFSRKDQNRTESTGDTETNTVANEVKTDSSVTNKSPSKNDLRAKFWPCFGRKDKSPDPEAPENTAANEVETSRLGLEAKAWTHRLFPPNWLCFAHFLKFIYMVMVVIFGSGTTLIEKLRRRKQKHVWSIQIMNALLLKATMYESDDNGGSKPDSTKVEDDETSFYNVKNVSGSNTSDDITQNQQPSTSKAKDQQQDKEKGEGEKKDKKPENGKKMDTPILIAAKHGVIEMVEKILKMFPVAVHDMDANKKNIVLLAIENRQAHLYELLYKKNVLKESLFRKVDKEGNSALHLAAKFGESNKPWLISGAALQMHWEIKWYLFVKESMPAHFFYRYNKLNKTPKEIFTETHKDLVKSGSEWLKQTSESCSLVAALIATVAFATSSTVPGGVQEQTGVPTFESEPAFKIFAISSLIALCCSVTSVVLFLSILTSRFQEYDFGRNLPRKLIVGLTALFMSIASMLVSFCAGHFLVLRNKLRYAALPIYAVTCLPVTLFALAQFPLYFDLIWATFKKVPQHSHKSTRL